MRLFWILVAVLVVVGVRWLAPHALSAPTRLVNDVSWPNCKEPLARSDAGIVGVTGGLALRPNPCLAYEAGLYKQTSVYVNTGFPEGNKAAGRFKNSPKKCSTKNEQCLAYNYGYNSGVFDFNYALKRGVVAKSWWLDVETENSWSDNSKINRVVLQGTLDALAPRVGRLNLGFYSYPAQWNIITGNWHNNFPAWQATGAGKLADAQKACEQPAFNGGSVKLGQYTAKLDLDYQCP